MWPSVVCVHVCFLSLMQNARGTPNHLLIHLVLFQHGYFWLFWHVLFSPCHLAPMNMDFDRASFPAQPQVHVVLRWLALFLQICVRGTAWQQARQTTDWQGSLEKWGKKMICIKGVLCVRQSPPLDIQFVTTWQTHFLYYMYLFNIQCSLYCQWKHLLKFVNLLKIMAAIQDNS